MGTATGSIPAGLVVRMWTGIGAETMVWDGGSDNQSDGNNDL